MKFVSTRGGERKWGFEEAVWAGIPDGGGLFVPESIPEISAEQFRDWAKQKLAEPTNHSDLFARIATDILNRFIDEEELSKTELYDLIRSTVNFPIKFSHIQDSQVLNSHDPAFSESQLHWKPQDLHLMELFHGPTFTFKDIGLQFLGKLLGFFLSRISNPHKVAVVVATSGDTGSAAISAVQDHPLIDLYVIYPSGGRISNLQERQMATVTSKNIHCFSFDGMSDEADIIVNGLFADEQFKHRFHLNTINSFNISRILMQTVNYFFAYIENFAEKIVENFENSLPLPIIRYVVPSGGFGNGASGYLAQQMGSHIAKFIFGTNSNDTIHKLFSSGLYEISPSNPTLAPAIDISNPYNLERLLYFLSNKNHSVVKEIFCDADLMNGVTPRQLSDELTQKLKQTALSFSCADSEISRIIGDFYEKYQYFIDPHSAVGVYAFEKLLQQESEQDYLPTIVLCTAHPAKFPETIQKITQAKVPLPEVLANLLDAPLRFESLPSGSEANINRLKNLIAQNYEISY